VLYPRETNWKFAARPIVFIISILQTLAESLSVTFFKKRRNEKPRNRSRFLIRLYGDQRPRQQHQKSLLLIVSYFSPSCQSIENAILNPSLMRILKLLMILQIWLHFLLFRDDIKDCTAQRSCSAHVNSSRCSTRHIPVDQPMTWLWFVLLVPRLNLLFNASVFYSATETWIVWKEIKDWSAKSFTSLQSIH
jgi:hypothetical protein